MMCHIYLSLDACLKKNYTDGEQQLSSINIESNPNPKLDIAIWKLFNFYIMFETKL
jgi:hypothetical protein